MTSGCGSSGPVNAALVLPVVVYMHGGGWILGNAGTHDRLVRELAVGARAAVAFVEYTPSPEARYPVAIEQGYATAQWLTREGSGRGMDADRMAVAGESVGGNMTAALALMAKERGDVTFVQASMYYPVTDAAMDTASYDQFATGYYLSRGWGHGVVLGRLRRPPTTRSGRRSPRRRTGRPWIMSAGCRRRTCASTRPTSSATRARPTPPSSAPRACRSRPSATTAPSTTSMLLNSLSDTHATRAAIAQATAFLRAALGTD